MAKFNQLSDEELKFVGTTTAQNVNTFGQEYLKQFGMPKSILRIQTLWYGRKKYAKKYAQAIKVKPTAKKIVLPQAKKPVAPSLPDGGELLTKIYNRLGMIESIMRDINHTGQKQFTIFEALLNKKNQNPVETKK